MSNKKTHPWYFTFGSGHFDDNNDNLGNSYTIIRATSIELASSIMSQKRGNKWSHSYKSAEDAGVERWGLVHIPFDQLTPQNGPTR